MWLEGEQTHHLLVTNLEELANIDFGVESEIFTRQISDAMPIKILKHIIVSLIK